MSKRPTGTPLVAVCFKEFYSAHRAEWNYGAQCAMHTRLTLPVAVSLP